MIGSIILVIAVCTVIGVFLIALAETGGYCGDSSMVPGCLLASLVLMFIVIGVGWLAGKIIIQ